MELIQRVVNESLPLSLSETGLQPGEAGPEHLDIFSSIVLKFSKKATPETIEWLLNLIKAPVLSGGADLIPSVKSDDSDESKRTYYVSASCERLLKAADKYRIMKMTEEGFRQDFSYENRHKFPGFTDDSNDTFLSSSEKQFLILQCLNDINATSELGSVPGFPKAILYADRPVVPRCLAYDVITLFPLHEMAKLKSLRKDWYGNFNKWNIPVDDIRQYYGETIALYFAFLGFYTKFLIPPCLIAVFHKFFMYDDSKEENAWFAVLNLIWATVFLEIWKRNCSVITFQWGRLGTNRDESRLTEQPRAEFKGIKRISPITGLPEPYYSTWKRRVKMYCVSFPLLLFCLQFAILGMWLYLDFQQMLARKYKNEAGFFINAIKRIPSMLYAVAIFVLNNVYSRIATKLNDWENHRLSSSYNNSLIVKLVLFHSVNSFISLFYIAFYLHDMELLRQHLATLLITQQLIQQVQESLIPYLTYQKQHVKVEKEGKKITLKREKIKDKITKQEKLPVYSGTFGDYLEMYIQFGYVFLFSAAYPLAAFWALMNNLIEIRSDAFKLCRMYRRPFFECASSIGAWQAAFEMMSIVAVMTNCALIAMSKSTQKSLSNLSTIDYVLLFVVIEHVIIAVKFFVGYIIPDVPGWITKKIAKIDYEKAKLLKKR
eukprot:gene19137-21054_t